MSRAFVKETDGDVPEDLPDLPISPLPNYVTAHGLAKLQQRLADAERGLAELAAEGPGVRQSRALIERERRWLQARLGSARLVPPSADHGRIAFGAEVTVATADAKHRYRIVGEDEAEPDAGKISWASPLARALIGASVGDVVTWERPAGAVDIEILDISY